MDPILHSRTEPLPAVPTAPSFMMGITVGAASVQELKQLALAICGGIGQIVRIEPIEHAARMKVLLCIPAPLLRKLMEAVMQRLPAAEFGRINPPQRA